MVCRLPQREDERRAKQVLEVIFSDLEVCEHDDGSRPGMHDLDLHWSDGRIEAMEVTSAASEELAAMRAAANDLIKPQFGMVEPIKVRRCWAIVLAAQQQAKEVRPHLAKIRSQLDDRLAELEAEGTWCFYPWQIEHQSQAVQALRDLGIVTAFGLPADSNAAIILMPPRHSELEPLPPSLLNDEVDAAARANATKLAGSGRDERHLFVWVHDLHPLWTVFESATMLDDTWDLLPGDLPNLPAEVTTVWVATRAPAFCRYVRLVR